MLDQQQQKEQQNPANGLGRVLLAAIEGVGYSVEVVIRTDIGERRCREMGTALFFALSIPLVLALLAQHEANSRVAQGFSATSAGQVAPAIAPLPPAVPNPPPRIPQQPRQPPARLPFHARDEVNAGGLSIPPYVPAPSPASPPNTGTTGPVPRLPPAEMQPEAGLVPFALFCGLSVACHVSQRCRAWRRRGRGPLIHTHYSGTPNILARLRRRWPGLTELTCKRWLEPAGCLIFGLAFMPLSIVLGVYLVLAGIVIHHTTNQRLWREREQALDATDGLIDMECHQEKVAEEWEGEAEARPAARVAEAASPAPKPPPPRSQPAPDPPRRPPARPAPSAIPPHLAHGLDPRLRQLLEEQPPEEDL